MHCLAQGCRISFFWCLFLFADSIVNICQQFWHVLALPPRTFMHILPPAIRTWWSLKMWMVSIKLQGAAMCWSSTVVKSTRSASTGGARLMARIAVFETRNGGHGGEMSDSSAVPLVIDHPTLCWAKHGQLGCCQGMWEAHGDGAALCG